MPEILTFKPRLKPFLLPRYQDISSTWIGEAKNTGLDSSFPGSHSEGDLPRRDRVTCSWLPVTEAMFGPSVAERQRVLSSIESPLLRWLFRLSHESPEDTRTKHLCAISWGGHFKTKRERQPEEPGGVGPTVIQHSAPKGGCHTGKRICQYP